MARRHALRCAACLLLIVLFVGHTPKSAAWQKVVSPNPPAAPTQPMMGPGGAVNDQYGMAAGHYERCEYEQAATGFREIIEKYPDSLQAGMSYFFLGESLVQQQDYQAAYPSYQIFVRMFPTHQYRIRARFRMAECAYRLDWNTQATSQLEKFIEDFPTEPLCDFALNFLGETRLKRGEPQLARQVFERAIAAYPDSTQSNRNRFGLAKALQASGEIDQALRFYEMLIVDPAEPLYGLARLQLGIVQFSNGNFTAARDHIQAVLDSSLPEPSRGEARYWLARTEMALKQHAAALRLFEQIIDSEVADELKVAVLFDGAIAASRCNQYETALGWLARLQKTWSQHKLADDALQLEIELLVQQKDFETARRRIGVFRSQFVDHPNLPVIREYEGRMQYERGDHESTVATFQSLINGPASQAEHQNRVATWRYFLGLGHLGLKQYQEAADEFARIDLQNKDEQFRGTVLLAQSSAAVGIKRPDLAITLLEQFLAENPTAAQADQARADLVIACAQSDQWDSARRTLLELEQRHTDSNVLHDTRLLLSEYALLDQQFDYAEQNFAKLSDPSLPRKYVVRGLSGVAWARMSRGDEQSAVEVFEQLVREFPETVFASESAMACGRHLEQTADHAKAAEMYDIVLSRFPESEFVPMAMLRRAYSLSQVGGAENLDAAENLLNQYRERHEKLLDEAIYQLAWIYLETHRETQASGLFAEIVANHPDSRYWSDAAVRAAQNAIAAGELESAGVLISRLSQRELDSVVCTQAMFLQGQIAIQNQDWYQVQSTMQRVLDATDDESLRKTARWWLAESLFQRREFESADAQLQQLITNPDLISSDRLAWVHLRRAQCLALQDQWTKALEFALAGRKQFPQFEALYEFDFIIGRAHAAQGRLNDARTAFQKVIDSPTGATTQTAAMAQWRIGETWFHQLDYQQAIDAFYKVDSLYAYDKWRAAALVEAGKCQEQLGNPNQAIKLYQRLLEKYPDSEFRIAAEERLNRVNRQAMTTETRTK